MLKWALGLGAALLAMAGAARAETNWELQAVDANGQCTYWKVDAGAPPGPDELVVVEGICLNNPGDMLDTASQWQIIVQGEGDDLGGTTAWAGKFYQTTLWDAELARLAAGGLAEGDRVRLTGYAMSVGGKANINERHSPAPQMDFEVTVLAAGVGLPEPEPTTLAELNSFDPTRLTGGERYQSRRITVEDVVVAELVDGAWGSNGHVLIADAESPDQQITLRLCNVDFGSQAPRTAFRIIGLCGQEPQFAPTPVPGTGLVDGYEIWVTRADGIIVAGDCNEDGRVSIADLGALGDNYGREGDATWRRGDFNGDGRVGIADLGALADNYGYGPDAAGAVPEPAVLSLLLIGAVAIGRRRRA